MNNNDNDRIGIFSSNYYSCEDEHYWHHSVENFIASTTSGVPANWRSPSKQACLHNRTSKLFSDYSTIIIVNSCLELAVFEYVSNMTLKITLKKQTNRGH